MSVVLNKNLPAQTANGADSYTTLGQIPEVGGTNNAVKKCTLLPPGGYTTVTGVATNNATITFGYRRAGGSRVVIAQVTLGAGTDLAANTPLSVPVVLDNKSSLKPGDVVDVLLDQNGTGLAINVGVCAQIEID